MLFCGLLGSRFEPKVVQVDVTEASQGQGGQGLIPKELKALAGSKLFLSTLAAGCFQSGSVGFMSGPTSRERLQ